ncbi:3-oxoacyl-[acyl-carrier protein] reductase [Bosea sp. BE271]|uniref:SDR family NAD(P)-dependent oxidoreductase n=1 Tax=Bosea TaxID=85413 RepID=UPI00285A1E51|nr:MULTISPECIES: SDR family oxidoreductase [Bosea]MDR6829006.1 3-oxoacyl-[acyl-carrier protein] reductase [Bosea robiniae]MDR6895890.1 3-oxoacyl-[acyl-carrier protein] reductase [Bosea sp. BE109]MDR7139287.1 3-oxoacyl-[acyl-carrier protein] reductase [Bosea sp. BE168]MDR7175986.1 3-oxoacyl-[acyl-carrier protein] reductase [Bosea sp. BE271]
MATAISPTAPALVFGGARGMGAAIVRRLAADGRPVAFTYVSAPDRAAALVRDVEAGGDTVLAIRADSANPEAVRLAVETAVGRFGKPGVLVVNAGILMGGAIDQFAMDNFDRMLAVNVRGVFAAIHYAAPHLLDGGRIVTIGSNTADRIGSPGSSVYAMTKAAVAQLVRGAALDFARRQITVNNVQPGPVETDMTADLMAYIVPKLPLGRIGKPEEIADLVAWLTSPTAGYMTGASLTIDGGWTA